MKYLNRKYQQGGAAPAEGQQQQIAQQVAKALQSGAQPEEVLQELVKQGMPQEQASQMIQSIMQQLKGGTPSAKNGAKLEFIQRLQKGGMYVRPAAKDATNVSSKEPVKPMSRPTNGSISSWEERTPAVGTKANPKQLPTVTVTAKKIVAKPTGSTPPQQTKVVSKTTVKSAVKPSQPIDNVHSPVEANNANLTPDQVKWVQIHLNSLGHNLVVDGKFGKETMKAIGEIQATAGLQPNGKWDEATRDVFKTLDRTARDAKQSYLNTMQQNISAGEIPENPSVLPETITTQPSIWEGATFAKKGGYLQKGAKVTKPIPVLKGKPNPVSDDAVPTKNEGGTDMNPKDWKKGVPNTSSKDKNIPSDDKQLTPWKKEKGGYLKNKTKPKVDPIVEKKDMSTMIKPKMAKGSKMKAKKCLKGCGCGTKLHKNGGILSTVCSCCGGQCN